MSNKIESLFIENLFEDKNIDWKLKDVNVLVGKNGLGKTTILQLINAALNNDTLAKSIYLCDSITLHFYDKEINLINPLSLKKYAKSIFYEKESLVSKEIDQHIKIELKKANINDIQSKKFSDLKSKIISHLLEEMENDNTIMTFLNEKKSKISEKLSVEYISTINMSANSINNITTSDGKTTNFLDYEIREELNFLLKSKNINIKNKLINVLNSMFSDSNKKVEIQNNQLVFHLDNKKTIGYESLSSGERQVIYIFIKVIKAGINKSLILMDEPEISLHLSWQEKLLSQIREVNKNSQIIIVTHSPAIVMKGWMDSFVDINSIIVE